MTLLFEFTRRLTEYHTAKNNSQVLYTHNQNTLSILVFYCSHVFAKDDRTLQSALLYTTTKRFEVTKSNWNDLFKVHIGFITQGVLLWRNMLVHDGGCGALLVNY